MRIGYSITSNYPEGADPTDAAAHAIEAAEAAAEAGLDSVEVGDHHAVGDGGYLQNVPMAARMTEHFDRVAPMFLLPMYDPVLVAEQCGTLAALCGEFDFWCALGWREAAYDAFGVPWGERAPRFEEALELVKRLWSEDDVTFDGEFYSVDGVSINPKADARIVVGGTAERAVRRAGRLGDAWVANAHQPLDEIEECVGWLEEEGGGDVLARRDVLALEDGERAEELAADMLAEGYRGWPEDAHVLTGDAEGVAADLEALREAGVSEVIVRPMSDEHAVESLRVAAEAGDLL